MERLVTSRTGNDSQAIEGSMRVAFDPPAFKPSPMEPHAYDANSFGSTLADAPSRSGIVDLRQLESIIEREMIGFEELLSQQLASDYPIVSRLMDSAAALQGKRLRPRLVMLSALACGGITANTRKVSAVVRDGACGYACSR